MSKNRMVLVDIGQGNLSGSDWWAAVTDGGSWITDAPSVPADEASWFEVTYDWNSVVWSPGRLARGKDAVEAASVCLSSSSR